MAQVFEACFQTYLGFAKPMPDPLPGRMYSILSSLVLSSSLAPVESSDSFNAFSKSHVLTRRVTRLTSAIVNDLSYGHML